MSSRLHDKIYTAYEARQEVRSTYETLTDAVNRPLTERLREHPDDIVLDGFRVQLDEYPVTAVTLHSDAELYKGLEIANALVGGDLDAKAIEDYVRHERQHADVAKDVGFDAGHYVLNFHSKGFLATHDCYKPRRPITKLGFAAILAAPYDPSEADKTALQQMGYKGRRDVKKRIETQNRQDGGNLALPSRISRFLS